jgi:superfamily II DNA or RNA helicase
MVAVLLRLCRERHGARDLGGRAAKLSPGLLAFAGRLKSLRGGRAGERVAVHYVLRTMPSGLSAEAPEDGSAPGTGGIVALALGAALVKTRKDGRLGRAAFLRPGRTDHARPLAPNDARLLELLAALDRGAGYARGGPIVELRGWIGEDALGLALADGRCHLDQVGQAPLRRGETRRAGLAWRLEPDGRYRATLAAQGEGVLLCLDPCVWIERDAGQIGALELDLPKEAAGLWLSAPPVPVEQIAGFRTHLSELGIEDAVSRLPQPLPVRKAPAQPPRPVLRLLTTRAGDAALEHARVEFDYEGVLVGVDDPRDPLVVPRGDHLLACERDRDAEVAAFSALTRWPFEPAGQLLDEWDRRGIQDGDLLLVGKARAGRGAGNGDLPGLATDEDWIGFVLDGLPSLIEQGWRVDMDARFRFRVLRAKRTFASLAQSGEGWLDVALGVEIDGETVDLLPVLARLVESGVIQELLESGPPEVLLPLPDGRRVLLPRARLLHWVGTLLELRERKSLVEGRWIRFTRRHAALLAELIDGEKGGANGAVEWRGDDAILALGRKLRALRGTGRAPVPDGLAAELRDYQRDGLDRLQFFAEHELGGVLADDMGLGKTVQALAHLLLERQRGRLDRPALVVAPASVIWNWETEARRFTPDLRVLVWHGQARQQVGAFAAHDLVVTTYALLARERELLAAQEWHAVVLDEAQAIKNWKTDTAQAACALRARHRLCLTGTPLENHLGELWSLFEFALPGLLGTKAGFARSFGVAGGGGREARLVEQALRRRIAPFVLRRTKDKVARELPPRTEIARRVRLEGAQRDLYETVRAGARAEIEQALAERGLERSHITILTALLRLRQVCCDPRLLEQKKKRGPARESAKLDALLELLRGLCAEGRRVLVFSQFTSMLALIEAALQREQIPFLTLTGASRDRKSLVARFQRGETPVFLISLKAGGTGLNLTAADTVVHYDPWWNPAVEAQATDRAHRIGQDKPVFVYKLIAEGTIEERIVAMQDRKRALYDAVLGDGKLAKAKLTKADIEELLRPVE